MAAQGFLSDIGYPSHFQLGPFPPFKLRRTSPVVFSRRVETSGSAGQNLLAALTNARDKVTALLEAPPADDALTSIPAAVNNYLSLMRALMTPTLADGTLNFDCPLRTTSGNFLWTNWTGSQTSSPLSDTLYDAACVMVGAAVSLHTLATREAAKKASDEAVTVAFRALVQALNWVTFVKEQLVPKYATGPVQSDMTANGIAFLQAVISGHTHEIIVGRAEAKGHQNDLVCKLAAYTAQQFNAALKIVPPFEGSKGAKLQQSWQSYVDMKGSFFNAVSLHRHALILASDVGKAADYGGAVKAGETAVQLLEKALAIAAAIGKENKLDAAVILPQNATTGRRIRKEVDTIVRTNNLVHRAKPPPQMPPLPEAQSTLPSNPFTLPPVSELCSETAITDIVSAVGPKT